MDDFFIYSRDRPEAAALREDRELLERHWSYMDNYAETMVARGPTFADDAGEVVTGSLHVVGLADATAARAFVDGEPNQRAGVYGDHRIRRFANLLGRTMWQFPGLADRPKYLAMVDGAAVAPDALPPALRDGLLVYGALTAADDDRPAGVALVVQETSRADAEALLDQVWPDAGRELHAWELGGRR